MTIRLDDRAGSSALAPHLTALGASPILTRLDYGDVAFEGDGPGGQPVRTGIEVKSLSDILTCITTGRYAGHQLPGMQRAYDQYWLLVHGVWKTDPSSGVLYIPRRGAWQPLRVGPRCYMGRDLDKYLFSVTIQTGARFWRVGSEQEAAAWVHALYSWWQRPWDDHKSTQVFDLSGPMILLEQPTLLRLVAKELPGIGWKKSKDVENTFPNVAIMAQCEERDWWGIPGVGKVLAKRIVHALYGLER